MRRPSPATRSLPSLTMRAAMPRISKPFPIVPAVGGRLAVLVQGMVFTGGIAALAWEVIWQLQASLAFGVSAAGTALTLAATMGGMTCGALAMGRWLRSRVPAHPLRL